MKAFGEDANVAESHERLGEFEFRFGDPSLANEHLRRSLEIRERALPAGDARIAIAHHRLGQLSLQTGDQASAREHLERAEALITAALPEQNPHVVEVIRARGELEMTEGAYADALARFERARALYDAFLDPDDPLRALVEFDIARALAALGRDDEAEPRARAALQALGERPGYARERDDVQAFVRGGLKDFARPAGARDLAPAEPAAPAP
ncbi:MAG: tetratricopeptide repeat protein [Myxococcales bacterium]|nr:tetratricopeptide repeat protein [Myxococcales bacterium]